MTQQVLGPKGSPRRRWTLLLPFVAALVVGLFQITGAQAVHDFGGLGDGGLFELDNNALDDPTPTGDDWETLMGGGPGNALGDADEQTAVPVTDPTNSSTDDTFCGGTKEIQDIADWKWCNNTSANDKNDIEDAYSAIYTVPNTATGICPTATNPNALCAGDKILYVGADRYANNGDSGLGFMFLQTGLAGNTCPAPSTGCTFNDGAGGTPHHTNGDLYVVSQFTGGGEGVTVDFYVWQGGAGGSWQLDTSGVDCDASSPNDAACATVFGDSTRSTHLCEDSPWPYITKFPGDSPCTAGDFAEGTFFEGGVNLTQRNITGCFKTILVDTSQSQKINESDEDFVFAPFEGCASGIVTTPQTGAGGSIDEATGVNIPTAVSGNTITVRDHAEIDVTGTDTFGGTVTFFLCGPFSSNATNCSSGGVQIGSPVPVTGTLGEDSLNSDDGANNPATLTSIGHYCWRAVYSGDASVGVPGSSDPAATDTGNRSECFKVNPITATLTTQASCVDSQGTTANPCVLGSTLRDTATLGGTAREPGTNGIGGGTTGGLISPMSINATNAGPVTGSIEWNAYKLTSGACSPLVFGPTSRSVPATGSLVADGTYPQVPPQAVVGFQPSAVGTYVFVASFTTATGTMNTLGVGPSACPETGEVKPETITVSGAAALATRQNWLPNDTAQITSPAGTTLTGTVTFQLFSSGDCTGTQVLPTITKNIPADATGAANDKTVSTGNTTYVVTVSNDVTAYSWKVTYTDTGGLQSPDFQCEDTTAFTLTDKP